MKKTIFIYGILFLYILHISNISIASDNIPDIVTEKLKLIELVGAPEDDLVSSASGEIKGTTYYFSSSEGDDENNGLSPETPKRTWYEAQVLFEKMKAGDGILLKRGDTWTVDDLDGYDMSALVYKVTGTKAKPKILSSYGTGNRPILDGMKDQSELKWIYTGKINNLDVWETTANYPDIQISTVLVDSERVLGTTEKKDFNNDIKWKYLHDIDDTKKLYTHINPNNHKFSFADADAIIEFATDSSYIHVKHIEVKNARYYSIKTAGNAKGVQIEYNTLGEGTANGLVSVGEGAKYRYNIIDSKQPLFDYLGSTTYPCGGWEGIRVWAGEWGKNNKLGTEIAYNTIINFSHANVAINGDDETGASFKGVNYHHNLLKSPNLLYGGKTSVQFNVNGIKFHHNYTIGGDRNQLSGFNGRYYDNVMINKIYSPFKDHNTGEGFYINDFKGFTGNIFKNNLFYNLPGPGIALYDSNNGEIKNNIIDSNIFYDTGKQDLVYPGGHKDVAIYIRAPSIYYKYSVYNTQVKNNIIYNSTNNKNVIFIGAEYEREDTKFLFPANKVPTLRKNVFKNNVYK